MSQYLENLPLGETVDVRGPNGLIEYTSPGIFAARADKKSVPFAKRTQQVCNFFCFY